MQAGLLGARQVIALDLNPRALLAVTKSWHLNGLEDYRLQALNSDSFSALKNQKNYVQLASLYGFNQPEIIRLIDKSVNLIQEIVEKYPSLKQIGSIAIKRILNLLKPPTNSLESYIENPQGPISEVIQNEINRGVTSIELARIIHQFQLKLAQRILDNK